MLISVHSVKSTCATSRGFSHWQFFAVLRPSYENVRYPSKQNKYGFAAAAVRSLLGHLVVALQNYFVYSRSHLPRAEVDGDLNAAPYRNESENNFFTGAKLAPSRH
jgi:hypothetical protein